MSRVTIFDIETESAADSVIDAMMPEHLKDTARLPAELEKPDTPTLDSFRHGSLKDPDKLRQWQEGKLADWHAEHRAKIAKWNSDKLNEKLKWLERACLNAETAVVRVIGMIEGEAATIIAHGEVPDEARKKAIGWAKSELGINLALEFVKDEPAMLALFWRHAAKKVSADERRFGGFFSNGFDVPMLVRRSWITNVPVKWPGPILNRGYVSDKYFVDLLDEWKVGNREMRPSLEEVRKALGIRPKLGNGQDFGQYWRNDPFFALQYNATDLVIERDIAHRMGINTEPSK